MSKDGASEAQGVAGAGASGVRCRDVPGVRWRVAAGILLVAAVAYNDWLLQFWVRTGLDQRNSYISEAFAADQPHRELFSVVELATAALVMAAASLVVTAVPWGWSTAGWGALAAFATCSVADVALPMRCAPSREAGCPADSIAHTMTSGLVHFALFASMAAFAISARSSPGGGCRAGRWARWLLPVSMAAAISSTGPYIGRPGGHGIAQRVHLLTVGLWFWLLAAEAWREQRGTRLY
ncbi:DUF998 domain-containing protein [Streptomyces roseochromogenus]|uniref:DUF998 domain-containing protein n=1 Tax=Streptomyces roseochromogenus subsp. oscitans DS 12.976 TaxID=1352936 RepID=V6L6E2_STRRC|nr:DUF998 domain-containing protein [Streptomyces roseochromogenus]EST36779.1 hypothetical protein M878_00620 [Streptomyces roseochromogenus subsp. oscitans DS 12.976]